jgi:hypothetical protein
VGTDPAAVHGAMRLLVNLTNENDDACEHFARTPATLDTGVCAGWAHLTAARVCSYTLRCTVSGVVLASDHVPTPLYFDWMSVGLGLLVNLVEHHPVNREALRRPRTCLHPRSACADLCINAGALVSGAVG